MKTRYWGDVNGINAVETSLPPVNGKRIMVIRVTWEDESGTSIQVDLPMERRETADDETQWAVDTGSMTDRIAELWDILGDVAADHREAVDDALRGGR